jgi:hypothetical protein
VLEADRAWVLERQRQTWLDLLCVEIHWIKLIAEDARKVTVQVLE